MAESALPPDPASIFDHLSPLPSNTVVTYDLEPFVSAPAVVARAGFTGSIQLLTIPETKVPSPLAPQLSPQILIELKKYFVGEGPGKSRYGGNGKEAWLSWKRAWDLWNNHYIEGRVNPIWIREEWERRKEAKRTWNNERDNRRRKKREQRERRRVRSGVNADHESDVGMAGFDDSGPGEDFVGSDAESEASNSEPLWSTVDEDGSSGGWFAIKDLPEFRETPPAGDEEDFIFDDLVENSVWRPRRVGEKTLKIDLDEDIEDFLRNSELEVEGGFDCGRSPYPVLRSLVEYVMIQEGNPAWKKKKIWDGVTGTIFNMPSKPLEPEKEPEDEKLEMVGKICGNSYQDFKEDFSSNDDIFPLDIRRVLKVGPEIKNSIPLIVDHESFLYDQSTKIDDGKFTQRFMKKDDPWYKTEKQRVLMDHPPRRYPPHQQTYESQLIPMDDTIWREEYEKDQHFLARYFVTNLHGGTLLVNGMEIRKGEVAGPLPKFAYIETPGGQVSFWFGVGGRKHGEGDESKYEWEQWRDLRRLPGWKYTGLTSGEVWSKKINNRAEREKRGNSENDDGEWENWKKSESIKTKTPSDVEYQLAEGTGALPDNIAQPNVSFSSEEAELSWIVTQSTLSHSKPNQLASLIVPGEDQFFTGRTPRERFLVTEGPTGGFVKQVWEQSRDLAIGSQKQLVQKLAREEARMTQAKQESLQAILKATETQRANAAFEQVKRKARVEFGETHNGKNMGNPKRKVIEDNENEEPADKKAKYDKDLAHAAREAALSGKTGSEKEDAKHDFDNNRAKILQDEERIRISRKKKRKNPRWPAIPRHQDNNSEYEKMTGVTEETEKRAKASREVPKKGRDERLRNAKQERRDKLFADQQKVNAERKQTQNARKAGKKASNIDAGTNASKQKERDDLDWDEQQALEKERNKEKELRDAFAKLLAAKKREEAKEKQQQIKDNFAKVQEGRRAKADLPPTAHIGSGWKPVSPSTANDPQWRLAVQLSNQAYSVEQEAQLREAIRLSQADLRDEIKSSLQQKADVEGRKTADYLREWGFKDLEAYIDYRMNPQNNGFLARLKNGSQAPPLRKSPRKPSSQTKSTKETNLEKTLGELRAAIEAGVRARATLENKTLNAYTKSLDGLNFQDHVAQRVASYNITLDDIGNPTWASDAQQLIERAKHVNLCEIIHEASDWEAQTELADLAAPHDSHYAPDAKRHIYNNKAYLEF